MTNWKEKLAQEIILAEGYLTGLFWKNPDNYNFYSEEKINHSSFLNPVYGYYFTLGRKLNEKDIRVFDDISVSKMVNDTNTNNLYQKYGEYDTIFELMQEVEGKEDNVDAYYNEIKKYSMLKRLVQLFGEQILAQEGKYDYHKMTKNQLYTYWNDKVNKLSMDGDNKFEEEHLFKGLRDRAKNWNENPSVGLPFHNAKKMTKICTGWDYGNVYILGGFGGSGKTALSYEKVIQSCVNHREELVIIANEQSTDEFAKLAVIAGMGSIKSSIQRQRINEGNWNEKETERIENGITFIEDSLKDEDGNIHDDLIKIVFMENYVMDDVKTIIKYYAARGVRRFMVDTAKPSEGGQELVRWERFVEDFKTLYNLARPNAGGLNIAIWANVQLADAALNRRFLNEHAFGDSKKIKNEAAVVFMFRSVWDDEYEGGKHEIVVTRYVPDSFKSSGYSEEEFKLKRGKQYLLLFTSKNRRGLDNKTGQKVIVIEPNFNGLIFDEIGETIIYDDKNY